MATKNISNEKSLHSRSELIFSSPQGKTSLNIVDISRKY